MKKRIVVVCPGRGTYTKETLGYLKQNGQHVREFVHDLDQRRLALGEPTITELDSAEAFKPQVHTKGEHASALIYACSYSDFMAIDRDRFEIVAITGNSMGWYLTLALSGSLNWAGAFEVINGMGSMMKNEIIGGQVIYPICDADWKLDPQRQALVNEALHKARGRDGAEIHLSIQLGGYLVFGANRAGVAALLKDLPPVENYPFQLINHAAFHTPLLQSTSERAFAQISQNLFKSPTVPIVDGTGQIWTPYSTSVQDLYRYTLGHQVVQPYDFSRAITVALKEFAPDHLVLLGPGSSLGGSIGQILVENDWYGIKSKADFSQRQVENPFLISMGRPEQRTHIL